MKTNLEIGYKIVKAKKKDGITVIEKVNLLEVSIKK